MFKYWLKRAKIFFKLYYRRTLLASKDLRSVLFSSTSDNYLRVESCRKEQDGHIKCTFTANFKSYRALKRFQKRLRTATLGTGSIVSIAVLFFITGWFTSNNLGFLDAATYDYTQGSWSGGLSGEVAWHPFDNWDHYSSSSDNIKIDTNGYFSLATTTNLEIHTNYTDFSTTTAIFSQATTTDQSGDVGIKLNKVSGTYTLVQTDDGATTTSPTSDFNDAHTANKGGWGNRGAGAFLNTLQNGVSGEGASIGLSSVEFGQFSRSLSHVCAINNLSGKMFCWGANSDGQIGNGTYSLNAKEYIPDEVEGGHFWIDVDTSHKVTCAIRVDNKILCWGSNISRQLGDSSILGKALFPNEVVGGKFWEKLSVGNNHVCAIEKDTKELYCWGLNGYGQLGLNDTDYRDNPTSLSTGKKWIDIQSGVDFTCAIDDSNVAYCWGRGYAGELGVGDENDRLVPTIVEGGHLWSKISNGAGHTCGILRDGGKMYCWGNDSYAQLGNGDTVGNYSSPLKISDEEWTHISSGGLSSCAIKKSDNQIYCWGLGSSYGLGNGELVNKQDPTPVLSGEEWKDVSFGDYGACGLRTNDNTLMCWGNGFSGQNATNSFDDKPIPTSIQGAYLPVYWDWTDFDVGYQASCARRNNDQTYCWGLKNYGVLGDGDTSPGVEYLPTLTSGTYSKISIGHEHVCAIEEGTNFLYCWGSYGSGRLGLGDTGNENIFVPTKVTGTWKDVSPGDNHTCAIDMNDLAYCWGNGAVGALGQGIADIEDKLVPTQILGGIAWSKIVAGDNFNCGIEKTTGHLYCWGWGQYGRLGIAIGDSDNRYEPTLISSDFWIDLSSIDDHACAIDSNKDLYCWGYGLSYRLGNGSPTSKYIPTEITDSGKKWKSVSAGAQHTCAIEDVTEKAYCWGEGNNGRLGNNDITEADQPTPVLVYGNKSWEKISSGGYMTCGLEKNTNKVFCWGNGAYLSLNETVSGTDYVVPTEIHGSFTPAPPHEIKTNIIFNNSGSYTSYMDSEGNPAWNALRLSKGDTLGVTNTSLNISIISASSSVDIPVFPTSGNCYQAGISANTETTNFDISGCAGSEQYLWYKVDFTPSPDFSASPLLEDITVSSDVTLFDNFLLGTYSSPVINTNSPTVDGGINISWNATTSGGSVEFMVASADSDTGPWTFMDKTGASPADCSGGGCYTLNSGDVLSAHHNGKQYFRYKAFLEAPDGSSSPVLNDVTLSYDSYPTDDQYLISSVFNTQDAANLIGEVGLKWNSFPDNTDIRMQVRTSPDNNTWSPWCGETNTCDGSDYYTFSSASPGEYIYDVIDGHPIQNDLDDQFFQYKITLNSDGQYTPVVTEADVTYVINAPPIFESDYPNAGDDGVGASQVFKVVVIDYAIQDPDTVTATITPSYHYSLDSGNTWSEVIEDGFTITALGDQDVTNQSSEPYTFEYYSYDWEAAAEIGFDASTTEAIIKIVANDGDAANAISEATSTTFTLNTSALSNATATQTPEDTVRRGYVLVNYDYDIAPRMSASTTVELFYYQNGLYVPANTVQADAGLGVTSGAGKEIEWIARDDWGGVATTTNVKIKITYSGVEIHSEEIISSDFELDTKAPDFTFFDTVNEEYYPTYITASTSPGTVHFSPVDDNAIHYKLSEDDDFSNESWEDLVILTTYSLTNPDEIYTIFRDEFDNISATTTSITPEQTIYAMIQDTSNLLPENDLEKEYRLFLAWREVAEPANGFREYRVYYRDNDSGPFIFLDNVIRKSDNYYGDNSLSLDQQRYYRVSTVDNKGNESYLSEILVGRANGILDEGEGGTPARGEDAVPPEISAVATSSLYTTQVTITWDTNEISNSIVEYGTSPGDFSLATKTIATMRDDNDNLGEHVVILSGLEPNTDYYFQVKSRDALANTGFAKNGGLGYHFRTPTGPTIEISPSVMTGTLKNSTVTIIWNTDINSDSSVYYSTSPTFTTFDTFSVDNDTQSHRADLTGLSPDTRYYYYVTSDNAIDNNEEEYYDFKTTFDTDPPRIIVDFPADITDITDNSALISWKTGELASSSIHYGIVDTTEDSQFNDNLNTDHSFRLEGLLPGETYQFRIENTDENVNNNNNSLTTYSFITKVTNDEDAPVIIPPINIPSIDYSSATITWDVEGGETEKTSALVDFGLDNTFGTSQGNSIPRLGGTKVVTLSGLAASTTYFFQVKSFDESGNYDYDNNGGEGYTFKTEDAPDTEDVTPPILNWTGEANKTDSSITISWTTLGEPADSVVAFELADGNGSYSQEQGIAGLREEHTVTLVGLNPSTDYHYIIKSRNAAGIVGTNNYLGNGYPFTTDAGADKTPPKITVNVSTSTLADTDTSIRIEWQTDEESSSLVDYGTSEGSFVYTQGDPRPDLTSHRVDLVNLEPGTDYYFRVRSLDSSNNQFKDDNGDLGYHFKTTIDDVAPIITFTPASDITDKTANSTRISWVTNEPVISSIEYGETQSFGLLSDNANYNQDHSIVIDGLNPNTEYFFKLISIDILGNVASSSQQLGIPFAFTTELSADTTPPNITQVSLVASPGPTSAQIHWFTNEPFPDLSSSLVDFAASSTLTSLNTITQGSSMAFTADHYVTLTGLMPDTTYSYQVKSFDESGNQSTNSNNGAYYTFTTDSGSDPTDTTPPVITNATTTNITANTATITWDTDDPSDSVVGYSLNTSYSREIGSPVASTSHSITLSGLSPETTYNFQLKSRDENGNLATSSGHVLVTTSGTDNSPPTISSIAHDNITQSTARIRWNTDEEKASSLVDFGLSSGNFSQSQGNPTADSTSHEVILTGLELGETYYYRVRSFDAAGNQMTSTVNDAGQRLVFTSIDDNTPPSITNVEEGLIGDTYAVINWDTNEPADSKIDYGEESNNLDKSLTYVGLTEDHSVTITGLEPDTTYYYKAISSDDNTNTGSSTIRSFVTKENLIEESEVEEREEAARVGVEEESQGGGGVIIIDKTDKTPPTISSVRVAELGESHARITWTTDEVANSTIAYGFGTSYTKADTDVASLSNNTTSHSVTIKHLIPLTAYHFSAVSIDVNGNVANSPDYTFTTREEGDTEENITPEKAEEVEESLEKIQELAADLLTTGAADETDIKDAIAKMTDPPMITGDGPEVHEITSKGALVVWATDRRANSVVSYFKTEEGIENARQVGNFEELVTDHQVRITGLEAGTSYTFIGKSIDTLGNVGASDPINFTTEIIPYISKVSIKNIKHDSVEIDWHSNTQTTSLLEYGIDENYGNDIIVDTVEHTLGHEARLSDLSPGTTYHFRVKGYTSRGEIIYSDDYTFTTLSSPDVLGYSIDSITDKTATISWSTSERTSSEIEYVNTETSVSKKVSNSELIKQHIIKLRELSPGISYDFIIRGLDKFGQETESETFSFTTLVDTQAPIIEFVKTEMSLITKGQDDRVQAVITWNTEEKSTSEIIYTEGVQSAISEEEMGTDANIKLVKTEGELTSKHVIVVTDFRVGSVYTLRAKSIDEAGNVSYSKNYTVLTPQKEESVLEIILKTFEDTFGWLGLGV